MEQSRPLVFQSHLLLLNSCQLLPRLTSCLDGGLRARLTSLSVLPGSCDRVNRLPFLPGLNRSLLRLPSGCEEMTR